MKLREQAIYPIDYKEVFGLPDEEKWDFFIKYFDRFLLAVTTDRREIAKVINYNDSRLTEGAGYIKVADKYLVQHGSAGRTGAGYVDITFPTAFSGASYDMSAVFLDCASGFDGTQAIIIPNATRTTTGARIVVYSTATLGALTFDWIAIETL